MGTRRKGKRRGFEEILEDYWSIQEVAARYGLKVRNYRRLGSVYRLETQDGAKRLKKFDKTERDMLFVYSACEHLACQGFDRGPNFMLSLDGHPYVRIAGDIYYITDWVDGRECDLSNICELEAACKILARMHFASSGLADLAASEDGDKELVPLTEMFTSRMKHLYSLRESIEGRARKSKFDIRFLKYMDDFVKLGDFAMADLERSGYLPENSAGLCVRNYGPEVLVTRPDGEMCLVDMDECCLGDRLIDLGDFIRAHCEWDVDRAAFMMEVYHMVYPITRAEASALLAYIKFPMDLWKVVTDNYYRGCEDRHAMRELVKTLDKREEFIEALNSADLGFLDIIVPGPQTYAAYDLDGDRREIEQDGQAVEEVPSASEGEPESRPPLEGTGTGMEEPGVDQSSAGEKAEAPQHDFEPQTDEDVEEALDTIPGIPDFGLPFVVEAVDVEPWDASGPYVPEDLVPEEEWSEDSWDSEVQPHIARGHGNAWLVHGFEDSEDACDAVANAQDTKACDEEMEPESSGAGDVLAPASSLAEETIANLVSGEQVRAAMEKVIGLDKDEIFDETFEGPLDQFVGVTEARSELSTHVPGSEPAEPVSEAEVEAGVEVVAETNDESRVALEAEPKTAPVSEAKAAPKAEQEAGAPQTQAPGSAGPLVWKAFPKSSRAGSAKSARGDSASSGKLKAGR